MANWPETGSEFQEFRFHLGSTVSRKSSLQKITSWEAYAIRFRLIPTALVVGDSSKKGGEAMQYRVYKYEEKTFYAAEGKVTWPLTYRPSDDGKKLAREELPCPCGCGFPVFINEHRGNCLGATLFLTYACMARATLKIDDVGEWEIDVEEGTGRQYSRTPSGTFHREGVYPPPYSYHPADDASRIIAELICLCGCGIATSNYCEHGNCEGATLYLIFLCGAVGELRMLDQGFWDFDVEPQESHQKPFRCV